MNRIETLLEFHADDPTDSFTLFALAREYSKIGDTPNSRTYYEKLVDEQPEYVGTYYHLGKLYEELDMISQALDMYRRGIKISEQLRDHHSRSELQAALMNLESIDFD